MNIDDVYINFWGKPKPKFTEMELALMEGGHSLPSKSMSFIKEIASFNNEINDRLLKLCDMVEKHYKSKDPTAGMVAAGVLSPDGKYVAKTSSYSGDGKYKHAERNAIEAYEKQYGTLTGKEVIITTLSPCNEQHDKTAEERDGDSCTELLNSKGIKKVYCGFIDPTQDDDIRKFEQVETTNKHIKSMCKKFADTFLKIK